MKACKVQFKKLGKRYFFGCERFNLSDGDMVVVNTIRGQEIGYVCGDMFDLDPKGIDGELKDVIRVATNDDITRYRRNLDEEPKIIQRTKELVIREGLDMKVLSCEYTLDKSKLIIYFESEDRVDFRNLVKDLADVYRTRIELRQVGSRDGAKYFGGVGPCGLMVCCQTWITDFQNVSVKMAKNQSLSLNPTKINGSCNRLLCCLDYEDDTYSEEKKKYPKIGSIVNRDGKKGKVISVDIFRKSYRVETEDKDVIEIFLDESSK
jgi:cell fate regulator YaaT (PSP1 superfamily)